MLKEQSARTSRSLMREMHSVEQIDFPGAYVSPHCRPLLCVLIAL
jgi:hypothetical protein